MIFKARKEENVCRVNPNKQPLPSINTKSIF